MARCASGSVRGQVADQATNSKEFALQPPDQATNTKEFALQPCLNLHLGYIEFLIRSNAIRAISSCPQATRMLLAT
jgi:hypothetical protein